jgi:hypothetical protein
LDFRLLTELTPKPTQNRVDWHPALLFVLPATNNSYLSNYIAFLGFWKAIYLQLHPG